MYGTRRSKSIEIKSSKYNGIKKIQYYYRNLFVEQGKGLSTIEDFVLYLIYSTEIIGLADLLHVP